jgi:hypothetical protein
MNTRLRQRLLSILASISAALCIGTVALGIQSCFYSETLSWYSDIAPEGHQNWLYARPWVGTGQLYLIRYTYAPSLHDQFLQFAHGIPSHGLGPLTGFQFRAPRPYGSGTAREFRKQHIFFGLFDFNVHRIDYDLNKDIGLHILEKGVLIEFPLALPALLFAILPAIWLYRRHRARICSRIGHCPSCGYDLRATPGKCPECGKLQIKSETHPER